jgi:membrane-associated phospholipid phosphatase
MPSNLRTIPTRWILGCAVLCACAALIIGLGGFDPPIFLAINAAAARRLPAWLPSCLTVLGHGLVAVMLVAPFLRRAPWVPAAALLAVLPGGLFSRLGKILAARPRPAAVLDPSLLHVQGTFLGGHNSFPSGHSITVFVALTVILLGIGRTPPDGVAAPARSRVGAPSAWLSLGMLGLGLLVAASRVMVGAHWPSDTLGGAALGMTAGVLGTWVCHRWPWWQRRRAPLLLAIGVLVCAAILPWVDTGYPMARPVQWAAALFGMGCAGAQIYRCARANAGSSPS